MDTTAQALTLRVLEVGHTLPTAMCGYLLSGVGAAVTKLVNADEEAVDADRAVLRRSESLVLDRGKDVETPSTPYAASTLDGIDVVLAGSDADLVTLLGTDADGLRAARPNLVVALATVFGRSGEYRSYAGGDLLALALGGLLSMVGEPDREPLRLGGRQAEHAAGLALFTAVMTGLYARQASGSGALVETSVVRTVTYLDWKSHIYFADRGVVLQRGSDSGPLVLECADGYVGFYYRDEDWAEVKALVADPRLEDERFATQLGRDAHRTTFTGIMQEFSRRLTRDELYHRSQRRHIPAGPVLGLNDLAGDPQLRARAFFAEVNDGGVPVTVAGLPWTVDGVRGGRP
jgi:crotonobetainyl-CoA:carnitine CoA-transferase CaiB-like acyl-CoA transferase